MLSVIIRDNGEPKVVQLTYENLFRELKDIPGAELLVAKDWLEVLPDTKNNYVCLVEVDCLVQSGYFSSMLGLFKKNPFFRKMAVLSAGVGVDNWANKFYGYELNNSNSGGVVPVRLKKSRTTYPVQIAYIPGAIIRKRMLVDALNTLGITQTNQLDLIKLSAQLSLAFWKQGDGNVVYINPNAAYVTTEKYVNDIGLFPLQTGKLLEKFKKESI